MEGESSADSAMDAFDCDVRFSRRGQRRSSRRRRRRTQPSCRSCLALCCIGVLLLSSKKKERSGAIITGGVDASDRQPPPPSSHRSSASPPRSSTSRSFRFALPTLRRGFPEDDDEDLDKNRGSYFGGVGREFDLFDTRGGVTVDDTSGNDGGGAGDYYASPLSPMSSFRQSHVSSQSPPSSNNSPLGPSYPSYIPSSSNRAGGRAYSSSSNRRRRQQGSPRSSSSWYGASSTRTSNAAGGAGFQRVVVEPIQTWWSTHVAPNVKSWPKLTCRVEPTTTLKIRKTFRPIGTIVRLGADFNTQLGVWQFKSSWEDAFLGGKLTLAGRELQLTKSWQLSVTAVEDLVTRLRCRAAVDLQTWKAYVRVGFRTERLSPINVVEGFTILKQIPLDGTKGHVKLEVKAILSLPEPEIEYSTETQRSLVGMGDIEVNVEELNLLLDY